MIKSLYKTFQKWSEKGSVYIISDTHFEDEDCMLMNPDWLAPDEAIKIIKNIVHKNDTLIHLGDVGNPEYMKQIPAYKVLLLGNHDQSVKRFEPYFDEVYPGPLFIADRILLSHEPVYGLEEWCVNIHGHVHNGKSTKTHINLASDVCGYTPVSLGNMIKKGLLSDTKDIHRLTIDGATEKKYLRKD
jgi:calcineurin-like phosphoesterase family protein